MRQRPRTAGILVVNELVIEVELEAVRP